MFTSIHLSRSSVSTLIAGAIACATGTLACSAPANDESASIESPVIGLDDLTALETAMHFTPDTREANGRWARDVSGTACYEKWRTRGEYRRYKDGAAFFPKPNAGSVATTRPIACVDVDAKDALGRKTTVSLEGFALDAVLRYDLGRPLGIDAAMMHVHHSFERGSITTVQNGVACGGDDLDACIAAERADIAQEPLARPVFDGRYISSMEVNGQHIGDAYLIAASVAYGYARVLAGDQWLYKLDEDPLGRLRMAESDALKSKLTYERLAVFHFQTGPMPEGFVGEGPPFDTEFVTLTVRGVNAYWGDALTRCSRPAGSRQDFVCDGNWPGGGL